MKSSLICVHFVLILVTLASSSVNASRDYGYHFHSYFFENNSISSKQVIAYRSRIIEQIKHGVLKDCAVDQLSYGPNGPHTHGNFVTCCNRTSLSAGISWFMQNRGETSVFLHPITQYEVDSHTQGAMWLGEIYPLDFAYLLRFYEYPPLCPSNRKSITYLTPNYSDIVPL